MRQSLKNVIKKFNQFCVEQSTLTFFLLLIILFGLIVLSHFLRAPKEPESKPVAETKKTLVYSQSSPLYIEASSELKKESVTSIVALAPGIVTNILVRPGQPVAAGSTLVTLTNDYASGGASLGQAIAQNNLFLTQEIERLSQDIRTKEERVIKRDQNLNNNQEDIALNGLKKERANRNVSLANARLNYQLSTISDAVLKPKTLQNGFVQSISVRTGQYVAPGQVVATISTPGGGSFVDAFVASDVAPFIDMTKEARITLKNGQTLNILPEYFSASEDELGMFMIRFMIPSDALNQISASENPLVSLPLRFSHEQVFLAPLDAIFQNNTASTVLLMRDGKAVSQEVTLGSIHGNFVEVISGINQDDQIILNRFVLAGDAVEISAGK